MSSSEKYFTQSDFLIDTHETFKSSALPATVVLKRVQAKKVLAYSNDFLSAQTSPLVTGIHEPSDTLEEGVNEQGANSDFCDTLEKLKTTDENPPKIFSINLNDSHIQSAYSSEAHLMSFGQLADGEISHRASFPSLDLQVPDTTLDGVAPDLTPYSADSLEMMGLISLSEIELHRKLSVAELNNLTNYIPIFSEGAQESIKEMNLNRLYIDLMQLVFQPEYIYIFEKIEEVAGSEYEAIDIFQRHVAEEPSLDAIYSYLNDETKKYLANAIKVYWYGNGTALKVFLKYPGKDIEITSKSIVYEHCGKAIKLLEREYLEVIDEEGSKLPLRMREEAAQIDRIEGNKIATSLIIEGGRQVGTMSEFLRGPKALEHLSLFDNQGKVNEMIKFARWIQKNYHDHSQIHRDIKPSNVVGDQVDGLMKAIDPGISRPFDREETFTGHNVVGTFHYMVPEQQKGNLMYASVKWGGMPPPLKNILTKLGYQFRFPLTELEVLNIIGEDSKRASPSMDVYAMGLMLYEALSGHPPFPLIPNCSGLGEYPERGMLIQIRVLCKIKEIPKISKSLMDVIMKALELNPKNRYKNGAEFADALEFADNE